MSVASSITTPDFACSLVRHPLDTALYVCGQYHLEEPDEEEEGASDGKQEESKGEQTRTGALTGYKMTASGIIQVFHEKLPHGVLSAVWNPGAGQQLAVALSSGGVMVADVDEEGINEVTRVSAPAPPNTSGPCTDLAFLGAGKNLLASYTSGSFVIFTCPTMVPLGTVAAHKFPFASAPAETWTIACDANDMIFTGGDDGSLKVWNYYTILEQYDGDEELITEVKPEVVLKDFDAGVTVVRTIKSGADGATRLLVGSYDETVTCIDFDVDRITKVWKVEAGGGVWRFAMHEDETRVLVGAMYGGACVLDVESGEQIDGMFEEHESMVYGAAWFGSLKLTCSFYDRQLIMWD
jgi:WD40 repeat protein